MRSFGAAFVVLLAVGLGGPMALAAQAEPPEEEVRDLGFALGDPHAPVLVIEYADFACDACGQFARDTWPSVRRDFVETGKVRWRVVPFELGFRNSDEGLRAAWCAVEQGMFWAMHDALFERQDEWIGDRNPTEELETIALETGLEPEAYRRCWDEEPGEDPIDALNDAARDRGVRATPTFFVNGKLVQGALPWEAFAEVLREAGAG